MILNETVPQSIKNLTQTFRNLDPPLSENENFDLLKTCLNGVYGLPTVDTLDKAKDEEALDPQQREVRIKYACTVPTYPWECLFYLLHALNKKCVFYHKAFFSLRHYIQILLTLFLNC